MTETSQGFQVGELEQSAHQPIWIVEDAALRQHCEEWSHLSMIALDTEFMRVDTFYPIPGLIQVADEKACYLIDPLKITDMSPLARILTNTSIIKVLHAASEDLELFRHHCGAVPEPLLDTQVAAAFAGWGFSMGLQRIVEKALQIQLGKGHTRSDWLQRPLSQEQILYAALDVAYLPAIAKQLTHELNELGRYDWMIDECQALCLSSRDQDPEGLTYYQRFTQLNITSSVTLAGLRDVTAWREQTCRARNLCRPMVLRNETVVALIEAWPRGFKELCDLHLLRAQQLKQDGGTLIAILKQASESAERNPPEPIRLPLHVYNSDKLKRLKSIGKEIAKKEKIAPELLVRRRDLEKLINSRDDQGRYHLPPSLLGWRKPLIGDQLLTALEALEPKPEVLQET